MIRIRKYGLVLTLLLVAVGQTVAQPKEGSKMLNIAMRYLDVPYVAHTLEGNEPEELVVNCDEVDCTTLVEYVLAESLCPTQPNGDISESTFGEYLQRIRYRNGEIRGYESRLHYIAEWINNGVKQGFIEDVTEARSPETQKLQLSYMSDHPQLYSALANHPERVAVIRQIEQALSGYSFHYVSKETLPIHGFSWIQNGDIIAITTNIQGLDVAHLGIAIYVEGKLSLLHASSSEKKVVVSKVALKQMLASNSRWTGIRVLRMKEQTSR